MNFIVRVALQKDVPAVGPGRRAVLPLDVICKNYLCGAINPLVIGRVVPRRSLCGARIELSCFHIEINVLIIDVLDGVGLDPESYDPNSLIFFRRALDRSMHRNNYLDVIEQEMLGLARLVLLPETDGEAPDMIGSRGIDLIRQQRTRR